MPLDSEMRSPGADGVSFSLSLGSSPDVHQLGLFRNLSIHNKGKFTALSMKNAKKLAAGVDQ
jgi:hypothetical protein